MRKPTNLKFNEDPATGQPIPKEFMGPDIRPASYVFTGLAFKKRIRERYDMTVQEFIEAQAAGEIRNG